MGTFVAVFAIFLFLVGAMSIGVMLGRKPLKGSCGGMSALGMETACEVCGGDSQKCEKENQAAAKGAKPNLGYDAMTERGRR